MFIKDKCYVASSYKYSTYEYIFVICLIAFTCSCGCHSVTNILTVTQNILHFDYLRIIYQGIFEKTWSRLNKYKAY